MKNEIQYAIMCIEFTITNWYGNINSNKLFNTSSNG
jgi:hypothetical protein